MSRASAPPRPLTRREFLRRTGLTAAGVYVLGPLACAPDDEDDPEAPEALTLDWWDYFATGPMAVAMPALLDAYMDENPHVAINRRDIPFADLKPTLLRAGAADTLPDVVVIDNPDHQAFAALGFFADIDDQVDEWGEGDVYFDGPWASARYQDRQYGVPQGSNCLALFYNERMLDEAGVEPPTDWDELERAAAALSTQDRHGLAVSAVRSEEGTFQFLPFLWQAGGDLDTLDSPDGREALELWVRFVQEGYLSEGSLGWTQADAKDQFVAERAAMMVNGSWQVEVLRDEAPDLDWHVAVLPEGRAGGASILGGENYAVTSDAADPDAAWDVIRRISAEDLFMGRLREARLPSREDFAEDSYFQDDPVMSVFTEQLFVARARAYGPHYPQISDQVQEMFHAAITGERSVDEALGRAGERVTELLEADPPDVEELIEEAEEEEEDA
jgi:multiple sugar transport system substrate-binding protein